MDILTQIENYRPYNEQEERDKGLILDCLRAFEDVFTRENALAHMTASAWVVNERFDRVSQPLRFVVVARRTRRRGRGPARRRAQGGPRGERRQKRPTGKRGHFLA